MFNKVAIWGVGKKFIKITKLFPMITEYVDTFIDKNVKHIDNRKVNCPDILLNNDYDSVIICSDIYYEEIYNEVVKKYNIQPKKIKSLTEYVIYLLENDDKFIFQPSSIRFDICTLCQLNCADCYMRKNNYGTMGAGYTKFENFQRIIEDNPFIKSIEIANSGEAFLNPDIDKIIMYAAKKNIKLTVISGTNFNAVPDKVLEIMARTEIVKKINIAIDGASPEVYGIYRRNGDFNKVISNIKKLNYYKRCYGSKFPELAWQYILMPHNAHEAAKAKQLAAELDMRIMYKLDWSESEHNFSNAEQLKEITGLQYLTRKEYKQHENKIYRGETVCGQMIYLPCINFDGRLLGCCGVYKNDWKVNVFDDGGLLGAVNSPLYRKALIMVLGGGIISNTEDVPCNNCSRISQFQEGQYVRL